MHAVLQFWQDLGDLKEVTEDMKVRVMETGFYAALLVRSLL